MTWAASLSAHLTIELCQTFHGESKCAVPRASKLGLLLEAWPRQQVTQTNQTESDRHRAHEAPGPVIEIESLRSQAAEAEAHQPHGQHAPHAHEAARPLGTQARRAGCAVAR